MLRDSNKYLDFKVGLEDLAGRANDFLRHDEHGVFRIYSDTDIDNLTTVFMEVISSSMFDKQLATGRKNSNQLVDLNPQLYDDLNALIFKYLHG